MEQSLANIEQSLAQCICHTTAFGDSGKTIVVGFPGFGLVGTIAAKYIIKSLDLEVVGYLRSPLIPPLAVFLDGILAYPYRIYGDLSGNQDIIVLIGESPAPPQAYYFLANAVLDWGTKFGHAEEVICLDGFSDQGEPKNDVYLVAEPDVKGKMDQYNLPKPQTGYIGGLSGAILNESIIREIDGYALLVSTTSHYPDPNGAGHLIETINKIKNLNIDTKSLFDDGEKIKQTMQDFANRTRQLADQDTQSDYKSSLYL
ncbi:MAG: hypothetical protein HeimC3_12280 [Candidatus Heimdallarchaeota archaeon LC_3]|nr:MAG: hypothetical protein HeimC3_12280 [Candidatus Heimdallarchaeota archaeon LC_3]